MTEPTHDTMTPEVANPWRSMWLRPRQTIQSIIDRDPTRSVILLAVLSGFSQSLDQATANHSGDLLPLIGVLMLCLLGGAIGGIIGLYFAGFLLRVAGGWLGGTASGVQVRAALAWSSVPVVWSLLLWIPQLLIFGNDLFTRHAPRIDAYWPLYLAFVVVEIALSIWAIVLLFKTLGQVHGFSAWRGLGTAVIAFGLVFVPIALLVLALFAMR